MFYHSIYLAKGFRMRPKVRSTLSTFWPIFFKLCIDIGIGEEWYGIASGLISFWNNKSFGP